MTRYTLRRLFGSTIFVIWAISVIVFILITLLGIPAYMLLPPDATQADVDRLTRQMGLDQPWPVKYLRFLGNPVHRDFGRIRSATAGRVHAADAQLPAGHDGADLYGAVLYGDHRYPAGDHLGGQAEHSPSTTWCGWLSLLGQSMPTFWLGMVLILIFSVELRWGRRLRAAARRSSC